MPDKGGGGQSLGEILIVTNVEFLDSTHIIRFGDCGADLLRQHESGIIVAIVPRAPSLGIVYGARIDLHPFPIPAIDEIDGGLGEFLGTVFMTDKMLPGANQIRRPGLMIDDGVEVGATIDHIGVPSPDSQRYPSSKRIGDADVKRNAAHVLQAFLIASYPSAKSLHP